MPAWGGRGGGWLVSEEYVLSLQIGAIMCLFIIGPRVNGLKGETAHQRRKSQLSAFLGVTGSRPARRLTGQGLIPNTLCSGHEDLGEAQRGKGLPEATQQENELILDRQRHREVGKGWSGPGKEPRQSLKGQSQSLEGSFRAF